MSHNSQEHQTEAFDVYSEEESLDSISTRDTAKRFVQYLEFDISKVTSLEFNFRNHSVLKRISAVLSLRWIIPNGVIVYSFLTTDNRGHSIRQYGGSLISYGYWSIDSPRRILDDSTCPYKLIKEKDDFIISIFGWRCYGIKGSFQPSKIQICLSFPLKSIILHVNKSYISNFIFFDGLASNLKLNGEDCDTNNVTCLYSDPTSNSSIALGVRQGLPIGIAFVESQLNIAEVVSRDFEILGEPTDGKIEADPEKVFRMYDVYTVDMSDFSELEITMDFLPVPLNDVRSICQFWLGERENRFETIIDKSLNKDIIYVRNYYTKGGKGSYFGKDNEILTANNGVKIRRFHKFRIVNHGNDIYSVFVNSKLMCKIQHVINRLAFECGFEFQILNKSMLSYDVSRVRRLVGFGSVREIKRDGQVLQLRNRDSVNNLQNVNIRDLPMVSRVSVENMRELADLFIPLPVQTSDDKVIDSTIPVESDNQIKPDVNESKTAAKPSKNFVSAQYSILSSDQLEKIMQNMCDYYQKRGVSKADCILLIYQMGVSFCTSRNSMSDPNNGILWKTEDGKVKRFSKSTHSKILNRMIDAPCNVERLLLRSRSDEILDLLRNKTLDWPKAQAIRRGVKPEYAYLACDFFDLKTTPLSEQEQMAMNSAQFYVQMRNKHKRAVVNVNQLL
ncbi:minor coat protein [Mulberry crinivirus]|nr:minor coat protein [Mulberry crinivirus]WBP49981.1 minor coat protein [Mulberry crinivirus]